MSEITLDRLQSNQRIDEINGQLTGLQRGFIREYSLCKVGTRAAIKAGYSEKWAGAQAQQLLKTPIIAEALKLLEETEIKGYNLQRQDLINLSFEESQKEALKPTERLGFYRLIADIQGWTKTPATNGDQEQKFTFVMNVNKPDKAGKLVNGS